MPKISYGIAEINEDFSGAEDIKLCKIERAEGVECFCYTFRLSGQKLAVSVLDGSLIEIR